MQEIKEKVRNAASSGKAHVDIFKAKAEEEAHKAAAARTGEEKEISHQRRKAKEAKAKMELHQAKTEHAAEKLRAKQSQLLRRNEPKGHHPVGLVADPLTGTSVPTYPLGGNLIPPGHRQHI